MSDIGNYIIYLVMTCAVIGAFAAIRDEESPLGKEFLQGIYSIGPIFLPVAGIMAATPYLAAVISAVVGPAFDAIGADPSMAATSIIAVDMGGYQLAEKLATNRESWIMAMSTGYMAGATIVFSIPIGLSMIEKEDQPYMALGIMSGLLSIPIGVLVTTLIMKFGEVPVRELIATTGPSSLELDFSYSLIFKNLLPLLIFVSALATGLRFAPQKMIKGFIVFGRVMDALIKLVLVFSIVEYFTGAFSSLLGGWGFDPIIADERDQFRALEIAGYIGIMLSGAFPMVYLMKRYLDRPLASVGRRIGLEGPGAAGLLAAVANVLALFRLIKDMRPKDKVLNIAFAVCAAFAFGDHLAFTANFQPTMVLPVFFGKLVGGVAALGLAHLLSLPALEKMSSPTSS